ncbi:MAG: GNAT family N-acetyltransferase [Anaerolineaceae bacterium]|nr:GNAT family N-acetyltransferase [Anaerolineaceae bacterium]
MFSIRKATKDDAPFIRTLIWRVGINPIGLNWQSFVVAVHNHGIRIGCAQLKIHRDGSFELASVAVVPLYRHQGVADAMVREIIYGQTPPIYLTCRGSLASFYDRFGFIEMTHLDLMPAYFRRVKRVLLWFEKRGLAKERLAVMVWSGE